MTILEFLPTDLARFHIFVFVEGPRQHDGALSVAKPFGQGARDIHSLSSVRGSAMALPLASFDASLTQAQGASPATQPEPAYGPALPGICVFSRDTAIDNSDAGQAAAKRMQTLTQQVDNQRQPERDSIAKERSALSTKDAKLSAGDLKSRTAVLAAREQTFNQRLQTRNAQLAKPRHDALSKLTDGQRPALVGVITTNKCGAVLERANIYGFNAKMDITAQVTTAMNSAVRPFTVDLAPESSVITIE